MPTPSMGQHNKAKIKQYRVSASSLMFTCDKFIGLVIVYVLVRAACHNFTRISLKIINYYSNNYVKSSDDVDAANVFFYLITGLGSKISDELPRIDVELVESCIKQLKLGKSAGAVSILAKQ